MKPVMSTSISPLLILIGPALLSMACRGESANPDAPSAVERHAEPTGSAASQQRLAQMGSRVGLTFPPSARLLTTSSSDRGLDDAVHAKVEMTAVDYAEFIAASPLAAEPFVAEKRFMLGKNRGDWDPETPPALPTAQVRLPNASVINLGVDRSGGASVVVYVFWHET